MKDDTTPICPIPGLGHCVRERCNFWDEGQEECNADCLWPSQESAPTDEFSLIDGPCTIPWTEDFD